MIYSELAQKVIYEVLSETRLKGGISWSLSRGIEVLLNGLNVDRVIVWQISGDRLCVTHETSRGADSCIGKFLSSIDSVPLVLESLSRFPDGTRLGTTVLQKSIDNESGWKPYLDLFEHTSSHLLVDLRTDIFIGYLSVQSTTIRDWTEEEKLTLERIAELMSVLLSNVFALRQLTSDAKVLTGITKISDLFRRAGDSTSDLACQAVEVIASVMSFRGFKLYLAKDDTFIDAKTEQALDLNDPSNPFSMTCKIGRGRILHPADELPDCFEGCAGFILPVTHSDKILGVLGIWNSENPNQEFRPQDREIGLTMAGKLAECIASRI